MGFLSKLRLRIFGPSALESLAEWVAGMVAERDHLAAENAELRKQCAAFHAEAYDHYRATLAANATLDALRDLCGPNRTISNSTCMKMVDILYPQEPRT